MSANSDKIPLIPLDTVFDIAAYVRWATVSDSDFTPDKPEAHPAAVRSVLKNGFPSATAPASAYASLAEALRVPVAQVAALAPHVALDSSKPFEGLQRLADCLALSSYLGVSGEILKLMVPVVTTEGDDYSPMAQVAEGLYDVIRAKYPDPDAFAQIIEPYDDKIRGLKRNGLVEYLIRSAGENFATPNDFYEYFLIDTQVEGCARTSRVVSATSSLQLYVHRVLMHLEQDDLDPNDAAHVEVSPALIPADEWAWRQHYRVWEANRKVFLYPENYLEPELRDDKTPLFEELESTLLQQDINEQSVTDAYRTYATGFNDVARLQIAGAYHQKDMDGKHDVLHLFSVTSSDPPVYYYRAVENFYFSVVDATKRMQPTPWRKVNVQIAGRTASPVPFRGSLWLFWAEINSQPKSKFEDGTSKDAGYVHDIRIRHASRKLDGTWTTAQAVGNPRYEHVTFSIDQSTRSRLSGFNWARVYPAVVMPLQGVAKPRLLLMGMGSGGDAFEPYGSYLLGESYDPDDPEGLQGTEPFKGLIQSGPRIYLGTDNVPKAIPYYQATALLNSSNAVTQLELVNWEVAPDVSILNGSYTDAIIDVRGDIFLLQAVPPDGHYQLRRLGTTVTDEIAMALANADLRHLLDVAFQEMLQEAPPPLTSLHGSVKDVTQKAATYMLADGTVIKRPIDFSGLWGGYFRELFFHIPFLIANHLNSQQRFSACQRWYHYIFDPTSPDTDADRVWRYREFRGRKPETLRQMLTDEAALAAYRQDPFNPHAIARLRLSAYQKAIVMKYIDNLLDWGDALFTEFTMESVNEAMMLYVMAADILGPRPAEVGDCGEGRISPKTYAAIEQLMSQTKTADFLIEMEHLPLSKGSPIKRRNQIVWMAAQPGTQAVTRSALGAGVGPTGGLGPGGGGMSGMGRASTGYWRTTGGTDLRTVSSYGAGGTRGQPPLTGGMGDQFGGPRIWTNRDPINPVVSDASVGLGTPPRGGLVTFDYQLPPKFEIQPGPGRPMWNKPMHSSPKLPPLQVAGDVAQTSPVFCVPANAELLAYWDRVEDRLFKIRNCMDITGARRQLALFAPEIDPRLLVRARAAGLSLEDVLSVTSGNVPPYRFTFLIERAKQAASTVQSFSAALFSALEKKDGEELSVLRTVHEIGRAHV